MLEPLISLRLSHPNFLDAVLTHDSQPVYSLETVGNQTSLLRAISDIDGLEEVASIQWPEAPQSSKDCWRKSKDASQVRIRIHDAQPTSESDFLRSHSSVMSSNTSRKFHLPGQDRSLRWRRTNNGFECTSPVSAKTIAHFEQAHLTAPARLKVYVNDVSPAPLSRDQCIGGVSTTLLDYLVVTTLLLVTERDGWRTMPLAGASPALSSPSGSSSPVSPSSPVTPFTSSPSPINSTPSSTYTPGDSWYSSPTHHSRSSTTSSISTTPVIRPPTHRPRTSPSTASFYTSPATPTSATQSTLSPTSAVIRRSASTYLRQNRSNWRDQPLPELPQSHQSLDQDELETPEDVFDISPSQLNYSPRSSPRSQTQQLRPPSPTESTYTQSLSTSVPTQRGALRLYVPSSPLPPRSPRRAPEEFAHIGYEAGLVPHYNAHPAPAPTVVIGDIIPGFEFLKVDPNDLPPPYEEIDWTVRLRAPRRVRSFAAQ